MGSSQTSCLGQSDRNYLLFLPVFTVVLVHVFQTIGLVDAILLSLKQDINFCPMYMYMYKWVLMNH